MSTDLVGCLSYVVTIKLNLTVHDFFIKTIDNKNSNDSLFIILRFLILNMAQKMHPSK